MLLSTVRQSMRCATLGAIPAALVTVGVLAAPAQNDACSLLDNAAIAAATSLKVATGTAGAPIPGVLGRCTWTASSTRVIVTLTDAQHMGTTMAAIEQSGGENVPGLGTKAVGNEGADFTGGGYIVNVLDARGGFAVSVLGKDGTKDRAMALAKIVEIHR